MRIFPACSAAAAAVALAAALTVLSGCDGPAPPSAAGSLTTSDAAAGTAVPTRDAEPAGGNEATDVAQRPEEEVRAPAAPLPEATPTQEFPDAAPPTSNAPTRPAGLRPRADRGTTPEGVEKITFDDLILGMQADMVYRPWMLESETNGGRAKELDGKRVRLAGIMHGGVGSTEKNKDFVLLRNKECKFGPGGQADHLAKVFMKEGKTAKYAGDATVIVEGTLRIKPSMGQDGNTWSIYELEESEVK